MVLMAQTDKERMELKPEENQTFKDELIRQALKAEREKPEEKARVFYVLGRDIIHYKRKDMHKYNSIRVVLKREHDKALKAYKERCNDEIRELQKYETDRILKEKERVKKVLNEWWVKFKTKVLDDGQDEEQLFGELKEKLNYQNLPISTNSVVKQKLEDKENES